MKWSKQIVVGNGKFKKVEVWVSEEYEICQNIYDGKDKAGQEVWLWEITYKGRYLDRTPTMIQAKKLCEAHKAGDW